MRGEPLGCGCQGPSTPIGPADAANLAEALMFAHLSDLGRGNAGCALKTLEALLLFKEPFIELAGPTMAVLSAKDGLGSADRRLPRGSFVSF